MIVRTNARKQSPTTEYQLLSWAADQDEQGLLQPMIESPPYNLSSADPFIGHLRKVLAALSIPCRTAAQFRSLMHQECVRMASASHLYEVRLL